MPDSAIESTTRTCLEIHIRHFKRQFGPTFEIKKVDHEALQQYVNQRAKSKGRHGRPLSAVTIKKEMVTLNGIWSWAVKNKHVDLPLQKVGLRYPKTTEKSPFRTIAEIEHEVSVGDIPEDEQKELWDSVFLTLPEIDELLAHVRIASLHGFIYPMFAFAAHTGARRSEIIHAQIQDVDLIGKRVRIREKKRMRGHNSTRCVPLSPFLVDVLKQWLGAHPGSRCLFPIEPEITYSRKKRSRPSRLTFEEATHHFNQTLKGSKWERLSGWHVFRHSFCSNCAAAGTDQRMIDEWFGHQTDEMRRRYRHLIPSQQHFAIANVFRVSV